MIDVESKIKGICGGALRSGSLDPRKSDARNRIDVIINLMFSETNICVI